MRHPILTCALLLCLSVPVIGQPPGAPTPRDEHGEEDRRLPNGKRQSEEILKEDHQKSLADAARLAQLSEEVKADLEKSDQHLLSLATLKKLDEIDRLTRRIRSRMKR